jgi:hypothetical protein
MNPTFRILFNYFRLPTMIELPIPNAIELVEDRIKFKFYATEKHLKQLNELQAKGVTPNNFEGSVKWEIVIENLPFPFNRR